MVEEWRGHRISCAKAFPTLKRTDWTLKIPSLHSMLDMLHIASEDIVFNALIKLLLHVLFAREISMKPCRP